LPEPKVTGAVSTSLSQEEIENIENNRLDNKKILFENFIKYS